uniref:Uncharacterized protein n=1 Tax=Setaria digitata TaxID=48799 RepID=A0A915PZ50_9BILA
MCLVGIPGDFHGVLDLSLEVTRSGGNSCREWSDSCDKEYNVWELSDD